MALQEFKDNLSESLFGKTAGDAIAEGRCIECGGCPIENSYSAAGRNEFYISGLWGKCFDEIWG